MNANPENKKLVMFDFDGVLANTIEGTYQIHKNLNPNLTRETYDSWVSGNFWEEFQKAVQAGYKSPTDFEAKYQDYLLTLSIDEVLAVSIATLSEKYILTIVSSMPSKTIANFLTKQNTVSYFGDIMGVDVHKSKVIKIGKLLEKYQVNPADAVFITDTLGDIHEAEACSVKSIAVLWGQLGREILEKGNPVAIIKDPRELIGTIQNVLK